MLNNKRETLMIQFWLENIKDLINPNNLSFDSNSNENYNKILNLIALSSILIGSALTVVKKKSIYFGFIVIILSLTILIHSNISNSGFTPTDNLTNAYDTGTFLVKAVNGGSNIIYINNALNYNKGDIIAFSVNGKVLETNIVSDIQFSTKDSTPILVLLNNLLNSYSKYSTRILKVSDSSPNIIPPPDANASIQGKGVVSDPLAMAASRFPKNTLPNVDRYDWNLELSTMGGLEPGQPPDYIYQGQPYGNLKCRRSTPENPMGTINVPEYDAPPTIFGTCNVGEDNNNELMTTNQESTVSQRVSDLLFHKGNSQAQFSPVPVDTLPSQQEEFAHWCYRNPTNLVNPKYASIFVNDPDKFKMVSKLARATGTENGGGGGR